MAKPSVLISGLGIAGPTLAYWLGRSGFEVTLVEHAPALRGGGYVIDFWGVGYDVAERMGLVPALHEAGCQVSELRFVDDKGKRAGGFGVDIIRNLTDGRYLSIARSALSAQIFKLIEGTCEIVFSDTITGLEQTGDGVDVIFAHGRPRRFGLVLGADGLHSRVRELAFGPQERFEKYLGYTVAAFEAEGYRPRDEGVYVSYTVPGRQAARFALEGDTTLFMFVFRRAGAPESDALDGTDHKRILHEEFAGAGWECREILARMERTEDLYFDRVSQIHMGAWSRGRVALAGDAAFCPSLMAGQGAALAMASAYVLAGELAADGADHEAAFGAHENTLRGFIASKQRAAERFASSFAPETRTGIMLRNVLSRTFGIPLVARLVLGPAMLDKLELPDYPGAQVD